MDRDTYILVVPIIGIGLSGFGWLAIGLTRPSKRDIRDDGDRNRRVDEPLGVIHQRTRHMPRRSRHRGNRS